MVRETIILQESSPSMQVCIKHTNKHMNQKTNKQNTFHFTTALPEAKEHSNSLGREDI